MRKPSEVARPRLGALATLPVFFKLQDSTVLVVGGSNAVAWKVELLAATGAKIRLVSPELTRETQDIVERLGESIRHHRRHWQEKDFEDVKFALGDFETEAEAALFYAAARKKNLPVNIIDTPKYCDFQFGSIVNRSPVIVSISTNGAAPVLAQSIRRRIETVLPPTLGEWARVASASRDLLAKAIVDDQARKAIWRRFADTAFTEPATMAKNWFQNCLATAPASQTIGKVTLVGAGPGDAELLTLKAVRALQSADVILFDDLVSDEVLELARREAKRMLVGKRGGRASCNQQDINEMMLRLAKQGKRVVRLKSGDPMIFGRAGEEIAALNEAGIDTEIIPGITAAMAAASQFGISLTHRDCAQGVKFITAHSRNGKLPDADWRACADQKTTLIVYMGAGTAPALAQRLLAEKFDPATPVMIAKAITRPDAESYTCRLSDLLSIQINHEKPVLIGIGKVFEGMNIIEGSSTAKKEFTTEATYPKVAISI